MALVLADRVQETTTTTGTGTVTLLGAVQGYQAFSAVGNGNTTYYTITGGSEWEVGLGTYTSSGTTLSRTTVLGSSNSGSLVNFSAGTKNVFVTYPASQASLLDGTQTFTNKTLTNPTISGTSSDANWKYRISRFDFEGANGDLVTYDYVNGPIGLQSGAALSTTQVKYGTTSLACTGGTTGSQQLVTNVSLALGTSPFCIEGWCYATSFTNVTFPGIFDYAISTTSRISIYFSSATTIVVRVNSTSNTLTLSTIGISLNTWFHFAVERSSTATNGLKFYVNGSLAGTYTFATPILATWTLYVGSEQTGLALQGYIDDFRLTAAVVYGAAFTSPTAALPVAPYVVQGMGPVGL